MGARCFLDAHTLIWWLEGSAKLSSAAKAYLEDETADLVVPAVALAEACWVIEKKRSSLSLSELKTAIADDPRLLIIPLDEKTVLSAASLAEGGEMHDRLIIAAVKQAATDDPAVILLSADRDVTASGLVNVVW